MAPEFDDLEAMADHRRLVHLNMTEEMRRWRYHKLKSAGFNYLVARRARDWHTRDFESLLSISPSMLANSDNFPGLVPTV